MCAMPVVADQGAIVTLRQIELATRITVVDEQRDTGFERTDHRLDPEWQLRQDFRTVAVRERHIERALDMSNRVGDQRIRGAVDAREALVIERDVFFMDFTILYAEARGRQRVDDLVGEYHASPCVLGRP